MGASTPSPGKVPADLTRRIEFEIKFPRTRQVFEGLLWTEEKNVFAGTVQILEHPYSFVAVREGAVAARTRSSSTRSSPPRFKGTTNRVVTLEDAADRYTLDGIAKTAAELGTALAEAVKAHPAATVLLRVPESAPFERVQRSIPTDPQRGVSSIRLAPKPRVRRSPHDPRRPIAARRVPLRLRLRLPRHSGSRSPARRRSGCAA